jgi:hypothetical protein
MSLQRLASSLDERLRSLASESRTTAPRHRTLRAVIDWSYALLNDAEKLLLQRLAAFAGAASLESVIAVAGADLPDAQELLLSLIDKSLVTTDRSNGEPRYRLPAATRDYARELLGAAAQTLQRRHAEHFCALLAQATAEWETMPGASWRDRYGADVDEVRGALEWAFGPGGDLALGIELVANSHDLWSELGPMLEHRRWVDHALRHTDDGCPPRLLARLLSWHPGDVRELEDPRDVKEALRAAALHADAGDTFAQGRALLRAGRGRLLEDGGETLLRQAHALVHPGGATKTLAQCLSALASARLLAGDTADAQALHAQAVAVSRRIGAA